MNGAFSPCLDQKSRAQQVQESDQCQDVILDQFQQPAAPNEMNRPSPIRRRMTGGEISAPGSKRVPSALICIQEHLCLKRRRKGLSINPHKFPHIDFGADDAGREVLLRENLPSLLLDNTKRSLEYKLCG